MHVVYTILTIAAIVGYIAVRVNKGIPEPPKKGQRDPVNEGIKRTGRIGLWVLFPPVGFWRSYKHGADRRNERLAEMINRKED